MDSDDSGNGLTTLLDGSAFGPSWPARARRQSPDGGPLSHTAPVVLMMTLGGHSCCLDTRYVSDVRSFVRPRRVPGTRSHIRGIADVSGVALPIFDLRVYLGLPSSSGADSTTVVIRYRGARVGAMVDSVSGCSRVTARWPAADGPRGNVLPSGLLAGWVCLDGSLGWQVMAELQPEALFDDAGG